MWRRHTSGAAVDHRWEVLLANQPAENLLWAYFEHGGAPGPRNLMCLTLHREGLRPDLLNLEAVPVRLLGPLDREVRRLFTVRETTLVLRAR